MVNQFEQDLKSNCKKQKNYDQNKQNHHHNFFLTNALLKVFQRSFIKQNFVITLLNLHQRDSILRLLLQILLIEALLLTLLFFYLFCKKKKKKKNNNNKNFVKIKLHAKLMDHQLINLRLILGQKILEMDFRYILQIIFLLEN